MDYQSHYDALISTRLIFQEKRSKLRKLRYEQKREDRTYSTYFENHHIVPKCLSGSNDKSNMILLTAREHYVAHWLLAKIYPTSGLIMAQLRLSHDKNDNHINSRKYELLRSRLSIYLSYIGTGRKASALALRNMSIAQSGENHPMYGKHHTDKTKTKMSASKSGENHPMYGKHHTDKAKSKMSASHLGKTLSKETKSKMSRVRTGIKHSDERKYAQSIRTIGSGNGFHGKHHTLESKIKMSQFNEDNASFGKKYWKAVCVRNNMLILNRWLYLDIIYKIWINSNKCNENDLIEKSIHIIELKGTVNSFINYFKNIGNPSDDNEWLQFKEKHGEQI